jgi:hypothetical protein
VHACDECNFLECSIPKTKPKVVADTEVSDLFYASVVQMWREGKNRALPEYVQEGVNALGRFDDRKIRLS